MQDSQEQTAVSMEMQSAAGSTGRAQSAASAEREDFELTCRGAAGPVALPWYEFDTRFCDEREIQTIYRRD
jgi:hypothetical protein